VTTDADPTPITLVLRTCAPDMRSHGGFVWPESGPVACTDWDPTPKCGGGLHGLAWGEGEGSLLRWDSDSRWLVVEVPTESLVDLGGKVKFQAGDVCYCGGREGAIAVLDTRPETAGRTVVGAIRTAGYGGTATAGYRGTATAGYGGTATAGDCGTATAGDYGTATAGDRGTIVIARSDTRRLRLVVGYVGEAGIEPGVSYRLDVAGVFVRAS